MSTINSGSNSAPLFTISEEDFLEHGYDDYYNLKITTEDLNQVPLFQVKLPDNFMKFFKLNSDVVKSTFDSKSAGKTPNFVIKPIAGHLGFYSKKEKYSKSYTDINDVINLLNGMKIQQSTGWRSHFSRTAFGKAQSFDYITECTYSYMQQIYELQPDLPAGWNLNRKSTLFRNIYEYDSVFDGSKTIIGNSNTRCTVHQDDFGFCAASLLLSGANKDWIAFLPKYKSRFEDSIRQMPNYEKCKSPLFHGDLYVDAELLESLDFPFWIAEQQPGYITYLTPSAIHMVCNEGINWTELVSFMGYRWEVDAHRIQDCCGLAKDLYRGKGWEPIVKYYDWSEKEMGQQWNKFASFAPKDLSATKPSSSRSLRRHPLLSPPPSSSSFIEQLQSIIPPSSILQNNQPAALEDEGVSSLSRNESPIASADIRDPVEPPISILREQPVPINFNEEVPLSTETQNRIREIDSRIRYNEQRRNSPATKAYTARRVSSKPVAPPFVPPYRKKIKDAIQYRQNQRKAIRIVLQSESQKAAATFAGPPVSKKVMKALVVHHNKIKSLSPPGYLKYRATLEQNFFTRGAELEQLERQLQLSSGLEKAFGGEYIHRKILQGYISCEIARDYIDGRHSEHRLLFVRALADAGCKDVSYWKNFLSTEAQWNEMFGIDVSEDFRIPAHDY
uniref:JmjC domain-containing protein n=1 Tax=Panagrolaimus davidi TaxID=227884 RepID=A0A914PML9_9BILA